MTPPHRPEPIECPGRDCGKPIFYGITPQLKRLAVDHEPVGWPDGNIKLLGPSLNGSGDVRIEVITKAQLAKLFGIKFVYRQHDVWCPNATRTRQKQRSF